MYASSTSKNPEDMETRDIIKELITHTKQNGWKAEFHCLVARGEGTKFLNKCRVFLSRTKQKTKEAGKTTRQFKLGSKPITIQDEWDVVTLYLFQTRVDQIADLAIELIEGVNEI